MELRLYSFVNFYLSPMQKGIQTGHAAVDLMLKYSLGKLSTSQEFSRQQKMVYDWAKDHKTFIVLEGGNSKSLLQTTQIITESGFPYDTFSEDRDSLNGLHTCTVVVLPDYIFAAKLDPIGNFYYFDSPFMETDSPFMESKIRPGDQNYDIIKLVTSSRLAA